jgi:hypothetical protein
MDNGVNKFDSFVIKSIIVNNQFNIKEVNGLVSIKSMSFIKEEYLEIEKLIKQGNIDAVKQWPDSNCNTFEYLDVMSFLDQNGKSYIVTVYDSDELSQDPQIIEIFP